MKVAVIGAGHIAQQHLGALREIPEANVVGVCDLSPSMAMAASEKFGVPAWFRDHAEMIEATRPDVLHVTYAAVDPLRSRRCGPRGFRARLRREAGHGRAPRSRRSPGSSAEE